MAGLLEKVRIGFLAQAHTVLDKFIDLNSPQAVRQYIRELESSIEGIENDAAEAAVNRRQTLSRDSGVFLSDGKTQASGPSSSAKVLQAAIGGMIKTITTGFVQIRIEDKRLTEILA